MPSIIQVEKAKIKKQQDVVICAKFIANELYRFHVAVNSSYASEFASEKRFNQSTVQIQKEYGRVGLKCFTLIFKRIQPGGRTSCKKNDTIVNGDNIRKVDFKNRAYEKYDSSWKINEQVTEEGYNEFLQQNNAILMWYDTVPKNERTLKSLLKALVDAEVKQMMWYKFDSEELKERNLAKKVDSNANDGKDGVWLEKTEYDIRTKNKSERNSAKEKAEGEIITANIMAAKKVKPKNNKHNVYSEHKYDGVVATPEEIHQLIESM